LDKQIERS
jgi:actin-related protein